MVAKWLKCSSGHGGWDLLIFWLHFPHITLNSMRPLHDLSHSIISKNCPVYEVWFLFHAHANYQAVNKVRPRCVNWNLISNSLSSFHVSSYNCTTYHCLQFWFTKGLQKCGRNFNEFIIIFWSTQRGPTLADLFYYFRMESHMTSAWKA